MATEPLLETWAINNRLNLFLLDSLTPEQWSAKGTKMKGVAAQFAHIHNVRLMWIKSAAPELLPTLSKLEDSSQEETRAALVASSEAMLQLLSQAFETGRVKGFKPHPQAFLGYLISHETFHRAHVEAVLRQAGLPLSDKIAYGLWEWGVR